MKMKVLVHCYLFIFFFFLKAWRFFIAAFAQSSKELCKRSRLQLVLTPLQVKQKFQKTNKQIPTQNFLKKTAYFNLS